MYDALDAPLEMGVCVGGALVWVFSMVEGAGFEGTSAVVSTFVSVWS